MADIGEMVAQAGQPARAMASLADAYAQTVGYEMMTVLLYDIARCRMRRIYSSSPATHPTDSYKVIPKTVWVEHVIDRGEIFVADTVEEFRPHYSDWEMLEQMGLRSAANFPIVVDGQTVGGVNLTANVEGYYDVKRVSSAAPLRVLAVVALLLQERFDRRLIRGSSGRV